jgi:predicted NBD/HSP70 family sugar kinase/DNA-binding transcriptional ArsR family regulator
LTNLSRFAHIPRVAAGPHVRRERNRARVVAALREAGAASRAELARRTGLSRTTVASIVSELEGEGMLEEREDGAGARPQGGAAPRAGASPQGGRPPRLLSFSRAAGAAVGIDFGKRHLRVAAADLSHTILASAERPTRTDDPAETGLDTATQLVEEVLAEAEVPRRDVIGVGLGLPGPIDMRSGRVGSSSILPGWVGVRAAEAFGSRLGMPVFVDNDANLGALAELRWGAAAGCRNAAYLKVSTGIGAGLILNGRLFHGSGGMAGEIGHTIIQEQGPVCRCGKRGCLETLAGAAALLELLRGTHGPDLTTQGLLAAAASGDSGARRVLADAGRHIGTAVATLCDLMNPELIVVGGELSAAGEVLLDPLREQVHRHAIPATARGLEIVPGVLGPRAELLGTLALVLASDGTGARGAS